MFRRSIELFYKYIWPHSRKEQRRIRRILKNTQLFSELSRTDLTALSRSVIERHYESKQIIFNENDPADFFYIIKRGEVEIFILNDKKDEIIIAQAKKGDYFGEQALVDIQASKRTASVRTLVATDLIRITHADFTRILHKSKNLKDSILQLGRRQLIERLTKRIDIFRSVSNEMMSALAGSVEDVEEGQIIFHKDDTPDKIYFLISGKINIYFAVDKAESYISILPGQIFGELAILQQKPRGGTAVAATKSKLLSMKPRVFYKLYTSTPRLRELIGALSHVYESPARGIVSLYRGKLDNYDTVSATFNMINERVALAAQVIGKNIFTLAMLNAREMQRIRYEHGNIIREIALNDNKIVDVISYGFWDEIGYVCGLILDNIAIKPDQISLFKRSGNLREEDVKHSDMICNCVCVHRDKIVAAIHAGIDTIDHIAVVTGAGTVCGSCRPHIFEMLGKISWAVADITAVIEHNLEVRSYRFKLKNHKIDKYSPGQYIVLQVFIDDVWIERSYTLTSVYGVHDFYEVTIKEEKMGAFSPWLFDHANENPLTRLSVPQGKFIFDLIETRPAVFFAGGIGVTPVLSFARSIAAHLTHRHLYIDYSAHAESHLLFINEINAIIKSTHQIGLNTRVTENVGRITPAEIKRIVDVFLEADFYLCGPQQFIIDIEKVLLNYSIDPARIHHELFIQTGHARV